MKKNTWLYVVLGAGALALFFAYRKRNVPAPDEKMSEEDMKQFYGMEGKMYIKPKNLIPDKYGRTKGYVNADGMPCHHESTDDIYTACKCTSKSKVPPTVLANFR